MTGTRGNYSIMSLEKEGTLTMSVKERKLVFKTFKRREVSILTEKKLFCVQRMVYAKANSLGVKNLL